MAKADLTAARLRELFDYNPETGVFIRLPGGRHPRKSGGTAGCVTGGNYLSISIDNVRYQAHRLAWLYATGRWPSDQIDHIDGDRSNNAIANLRESSHKTNHQNLHAAHHDSKSGLLGVSFDKSKGLWRAQIYAGGKNKYIGRYATKEMAHAAYLREKREMHSFCTI